MRLLAVCVTALALILHVECGALGAGPETAEETISSGKKKKHSSKSLADADCVAKLREVLQAKYTEDIPKRVTDNLLEFMRSTLVESGSLLSIEPTELNGQSSVRLLITVGEAMGAVTRKLKKSESNDNMLLVFALTLSLFGQTERAT